MINFPFYQIFLLHYQARERDFETSMARISMAITGIKTGYIVGDLSFIQHKPGNLRQ